MQMGDAELIELENEGEHLGLVDESSLPEFSVASALSSQLSEASVAVEPTPFKANGVRFLRYAPYIFSGTATPDLSEKIVKLLQPYAASSFTPSEFISENLLLTDSKQESHARVDQDEIETFELKREDLEDDLVDVDDLEARETLVLEPLAVDESVLEGDSGYQSYSEVEIDAYNNYSSVVTTSGHSGSQAAVLPPKHANHADDHVGMAAGSSVAVVSSAQASSVVSYQSASVSGVDLEAASQDTLEIQDEEAQRVRRMLEESGAPTGPPPAKRVTGDHSLAFRTSAENLPAVAPKPPAKASSARRNVPTPPIRKRKQTRTSTAEGLPAAVHGNAPTPPPPNGATAHKSSSGRASTLPPLPAATVAPNPAPPQRRAPYPTPAPPISAAHESEPDTSSIDNIVQQLLNYNPQEEEGPKTEWFTHYFNDDYLRSVSPKQQQRTRREIEFMLRSLKLSPGASLLDAACGYGRHTLEFAQRGYEVVGVDISMTMLKRALNESNKRSQRLKKNISARFMQGDMRAMEYKKEFDAAILWQDSIGYFDALGDAEALAKIFEALKPGGRFLIDTVNRDYLVPHLPSGRIWFGVQSEIHEEVNLDPETSILTMKRTFLTNNRTQVTDYTSHVRLYALHELINLLKYVGFSIIEISGEIFYRGHHLGPSSPRNIVLAERPR